MVPSGATEKSPVTPPGINPGTSRQVAQYLNHYAISGPGGERGSSKNKQLKRVGVEYNSGFILKSPCDGVLWY
jgi:hypothetical protein